MDLEFKPGTKVYSYLEVPGAAVERTFVCNPLFGPPRPRTWKIPVMILTGTEEGPHLSVVAGTHACEYPSIIGAASVYQQVDPLKMKGRLTIVPVVNVSAFWTRTPYINPDDGIDISATYGRDGETISYRIGRLMVDEVYSKADYVIDLHGGDLMEDIVAHAGFAKIGDPKIDETSEMLARSYGTKYIFERLVLGAFEKHIKVPRILCEAGGEGRLDEESTQIHVNGIINVMKSLNMLEGAPDVPDGQVIYRGRYEIYASTQGIFFPLVKMADTIKKGDLLGEIRDLSGKVIERIVAPKDGVILLMMSNPIKHPDDLVFKVWCV